MMMVLIAMAEAARIIGLNYTPLVGGTTWVSVPNIFIWIGDSPLSINTRKLKKVCGKLFNNNFQF
ncbi:MAG: hypothetical protein QXX09_02600 [Candidatus Methanomethylicia archaeon]